MDGAFEDTICAIATPAGEGGIGIIRISGPTALTVATKLVRLRSNQPLETVPSHMLQLADILAPGRLCPPHDPVQTTAHASGDVIDEGFVVVMKGPRSFTAEDVVELHCHGNSVVLSRICDASVAAGARLAQPGEFTRRAFLNGRLDLSQAEAVLDTIKAKSEAGLRNAQRHLRGELGQQVDRLRARLLGLLAHVEAGIDFVDEDISFIGRQELISSLEQTCADIRTMLDTAERGRLLREGARVVIAGPPNVGKSSLLNCLLRENRAIVTNIPGTTRDVIEESVVWDGLMITLLDTAGLRDTVDLVELEGMKRARAAQEQGDMVLHVFDAAALHEQGLNDLTTLPNPRQDLALINKCDLVDASTLQRLSCLVSERTGCTVLSLSAKTGEGLEDLRKAIRSQLSQSSLESNEGLVITNVRHRLALERAEQSVRAAMEATHAGMASEFTAIDLRGAADALGEITGVITSDEVLNRIFSEFCIGK
jgi:tRNA modification GTPase